MASSKVPYISDAEFKKEVLEADVPVLLDFTAAWCQPCKAIAPLLDQLVDQHGEKIKIRKIDIDQNMEVPHTFGVQSIPTLLLFKGGKMIGKSVGAVSKARLDDFVKPAVA